MTSRVRMLGLVIKLAFLVIILTVGLIYVDFITALMDGRILIKSIIENGKPLLVIKNDTSFDLSYKVGNRSGTLRPGEEVRVRLASPRVTLSYAGLIEVEVGA